MNTLELSEQEQIRRNSLAELRKLGINPYPAAKYEVTATAAQIAEQSYPSPSAQCLWISKRPPPNTQSIGIV